MTVKVSGISTDKLNEKMLKAAEVLKPLGIGILSSKEYTGELEANPKEMLIKRLYVGLEFSEVKEGK